MGTNGAVVGVGSIILLISAVVAESPPVVDYGKPVPPPCPKNEVRCCRNPCPPDRCFSLYAAIRCIDNQTCVNGCYCKDNYLRLGQNGPCVPRNECPPLLCVGDPNARRGCGDRCGKTCADYKSNPICPKRPCKNDGCDCKEGYIYDTYQDKCVLPKDCTPNKCGRNEEYYCGPACPDNEASCSKPNPPICINKRCEFKCFCKKGYVRDDKNGNVCIPADKCPINCTKKHEVYFDCVAGQCGPKTCDDLGRSLSCPDIGRGHCPGGCICEQGYLRDVNGNCIKMENCPPKPCGRNQTWMSPCDTPCPYPRCPRDDKPPPPCIKIEPCYPGCQCKLNYLRNSRGDCILAPECPRVNCTRQYEKWDGCPSACLAEGCDDIYNQPTTCNTLIWLCSPRCVCKKGHFRNKEGKCIPASQCPNYCKDPNASWTDCRDICPGTCQNPKPICLSKVPCRPGCQCKKGYVLDKPGDGGKCVKVEKCPVTTTSAPITTTTPAPHKCKSNEHWTDCLPGQCKPKTCDELIKPAPCPRVKPPCPGGCICNDGYVWDAKGRCIKKENCPSHCKDPNASWTECRDICPGTCQNPKPICMSKVACRPGCQCKKGYVLDKPGDGGKCVKIQKCPVDFRRLVDHAGRVNNMACFLFLFCFVISTATATTSVSNDTTVPPRCPPNEELKRRGPCPPDSCEMLYLSVLCIANQTQELLCTCKSGYLRRNNTCVPVDRCLPPECADDPNAVRGCGNRCGKTCADYKNTTKVCNNNVCHINGCGCKDGLVYDENIKRCVKPEQCSKQCKGSHEKHIDCPAGQCDPKTCDDLVNPPACPRIKPPCPGGCVCEDGYLRDKNGKCIPKEQCPSLQCKKKNERWSNCLLGECVPKHCEDVGYPVPCPDLIGPCAGGCTCIEGFVRNCEGECIDMKDCPCCGGDPYAVSGCGNPCGKTCASLYANNSDLMCPQYCEYNGCDCKPGYRLLIDSTGSKKCVPESECPKPTPECGANEQYYCGTSCPEASCVDPTPPTCVNKKCKFACFCKKGFVRDFNNTCIPVNKCPKCKGPHEKLISCPVGQCNPKTCKDLITPPGCPRVIPPCPDGCVCVEGYLRDAKGTCIEKSLCPGVCKDPNASWTDCRSPCPGTCYNTKPVCPSKPCSPGCQCNEGYVLSKQGKDGKCVKIETCADYIHCPRNQTFVTCTFKGCPQVRCPQSDQTILCKPPRDCPGGCGCKPFYRYDVNNNCIKSPDCPPVECTRDHEVFKCKHLGDWEYCDERYNSPPFWEGDPNDCEPKCACAQGYWRNPQTNTCVTENECPPI